MKRVALSASALGAKPAATEARVKTTTPIMNIPPRPNRSPARPAATRTTPKVSAYPDSTHCTSDWLAPSPSWIEGNATLTMLTLTNDMKIAINKIARMRHRTESDSAPAWAPVWGLFDSMSVLTRVLGVISYVDH